jgi:hypothetical protein
LDKTTGSLGAGALSMVDLGDRRYELHNQSVHSLEEAVKKAR